MQCGGVHTKCKWCQFHSWINKLLTDVVYRFLGLGDQHEVQGREAMVVDDSDEPP